MNVGFGFRLPYAGAYHLLASPLDERPMAFTVAANVASLTRFARDKVARASGTIDAEGLATARALDGRVVLTLLDARRVRYDLSFRGDDGRPYALRAEQSLLVVAMVDSFTTLAASLYDDRDREVGRARLRFDVQREYLNALRSFRVHARLFG